MNSADELKETETTKATETIVAGTSNAADSADQAGTAVRPAKAAKVRKHGVLGHPVLGAILLTLHGFFFYQILSIFGRTEIASSLISVASCVLLLLIHKWWFRGEYKGSVSFDFMKERKYIAVIALFLFLDLVTGILSYMDHGFAAPCALGICLALGAGTVEEVVFRALPVSVMMRKYKDGKGYLVALILSAVLFGSVHMINVGSGQSLAMTTLQALSAIISGLFFGALYLRTGSIVPSMFVHVMHDILCSMQANQVGSVATGSITTTDIVTEVVFMVIEILFVIWLLRGHKEDILKTWRGIWNTQSEN